MALSKLVLSQVILQVCSVLLRKEDYGSAQQKDR